ncbi:hypothetical protein CF392_16070 [Tamilnaduibacter salinus]|uniref:Polysaccharide biosynthesis protein n=1 Tax=Tamilnaduibacter salinus TaxID=1484056 RepID=A0A2A2HZP1_9GAMM|nr:oligosaccharide flippase family protein [Tamilnaduibacter salinus]PAV24474.1 hypothetical protein CF392_16070 [Tamilnaduibacter salinus]
MSSVRIAVAFSAATRFAMRFIGLGTTIAVARLLTPEEIGTFAIASAVTMLLVEFRVLGAGNYLVREPEIDENSVRSALGLTILICGALGFGILLAGMPVASFYGIPDLAGIFAILSISFFCGALY